MDTITLTDLEVHYRVGVPDAERAQPQRLLLTIEMQRDFTALQLQIERDPAIRCVTLFAAGDRAQHTLANGDGAWVQVVHGQVSVAGVTATHAAPERRVSSSRTTKGRRMGNVDKRQQAECQRVSIVLLVILSWEGTVVSSAGGGCRLQGTDGRYNARVPTDWGKEDRMTRGFVLGALIAVGEFADQPVRLLPVLEPGDLPPEFEQVVQLQVLGYRERLTLLRGRRLRVLDPVWTLVPRH